MRDTEEAFIAGLLHDVGVLFFINHYPKEYSKIFRRQIRASSLSEAEIEVFGIDHAEVGFHMAEKWCLPPYIMSAIGNHHRHGADNDEPLYQNIVSMAVLLAGDQFSGYEPSLEERLRMINTASEALGLSKEQVDEISSSLLARTVDVADYLKIDIGNLEDMLVRANQEIWKSYLTMENLFKERSELSANLLREERAKGAAESRTIAMATLSHYVNNATMAIYGRSQLIRMLNNKGEIDRIADNLPRDLDVIDQSIAKIVAVLEEMREISPIDEKEFYSLSKGLNIDDRIAKRMKAMAEDGSWAADVEMAPVAQ
jgi:signal transduction histidine kinase